MTDAAWDTLARRIAAALTEVAGRIDDTVAVSVVDRPSSHQACCHIGHATSERFLDAATTSTRGHCWIFCSGTANDMLLHRLTRRVPVSEQSTGVSGIHRHWPRFRAWLVEWILHGRTRRGFHDVRYALNQDLSNRTCDAALLSDALAMALPILGNIRPTDVTTGSAAERNAVRSLLAGSFSDLLDEIAAQAKRPVQSLSWSLENSQGETRDRVLAALETIDSIASTATTFRDASVGDAAIAAALGEMAEHFQTAHALLVTLVERPEEVTAHDLPDDVDVLDNARDAVNAVGVILRRHIDSGSACALSLPEELNARLFPDRWSDLLVAVVTATVPPFRRDKWIAKALHPEQSLIDGTPLRSWLAAQRNGETPDHALCVAAAAICTRAVGDLGLLRMLFLTSALGDAIMDAAHDLVVRGFRNAWETAEELVGPVVFEEPEPEPVEPEDDFLRLLSDRRPPPDPNVVVARGLEYWDRNREEVVKFFDRLAGRFGFVLTESGAAKAASVPKMLASIDRTVDRLRRGVFVYNEIIEARSYVAELDDLIESFSYSRIADVVADIDSRLIRNEGAP